MHNARLPKENLEQKPWGKTAAPSSLFNQTEAPTHKNELLADTTSFCNKSVCTVWTVHTHRLGSTNFRTTEMRAQGVVAKNLLDFRDGTELEVRNV